MWDFFQRLFLGSKLESDTRRDTTFSLDTNDPSEGRLTELDPDAQYAEVPRTPMPGDFPLTPPQTPLQRPSEPSDDTIPTQQLEQLEIEPQVFPELRTELGSHLHPRRPTFTPSPRRVLPPSSAPAKTIPKPALQDDVDIEDPWMRKSLAYVKNPFGRPVSAVRLFSQEKTPIPSNRSQSVYTSAWEQREKAKRELEREQFRPIRIRPRGPAVRELSTEWANKVIRAMRGPQGCAIARTPSGDDLYPRDIATCLKTLSWLNDEIINSYLTLLVQYLRQTTGNTGTERPRFHAFTTFFYTTLRDKGYAGVRRWANRAKIGGEGLLDVDTVFIPVHESAHWTLLVVRPADRTIEYFDSLDRMGRNGSRQVKNIKEWMRGELGAKYDDDEWRVLPAISSQQDNGSDCGVFLLTNAKAIALGIEPTAFGASDTQMLRSKIVAELMNGGLHGDFSPVGSTGDTLL
ncbi:uncharacterized protein N7469_001018 [Penicillium citrinum]|uniref:Ubiquitin-like protease family profile domain-containing protein n=1 Tax=Penicillium citrinum TaxID=5077 RepID=A0A9W9PE04_PENCI|nr:uncharacterized protein N7469_001018 [Penicillium citrinum]KAJ5242691.1 hypothetical protein N7469_001018 [Penicillium citrinum]